MFWLLNRNSANKGLNHESKDGRLWARDKDATKGKAPKKDSGFRSLNDGGAMKRYKEPPGDLLWE